MTDTTDHLRGPWSAVLADESGYTYESVDEALSDLGPDEEMQISIRRGTALPRTDIDDVDARLPGEFRTGDCIFEIEVYLGEDGDPSTSCEARYAQAEAMAAGLNAAGVTA